MSDSDTSREQPGAPKSEGGAQAVKRALAIIELLSEQPEGLTLSEISRKFDLNKAIVHRVLGALDAAGYIFRTEDTDVYRLTYKIRNIGLSHMSATHLLDQNLPILQGLADMTDELVRLAVVEGDTITWITAIQGQRRMLQLNPGYTFHVNLHTHATGKAWLSTLPRPHALELLKRAGTEARTVHSLTHLAEIEAELDRVQAKGYALTYEEDELGVGAVAVPIFVGERDKPSCVAVVSLAAPVSRMTREELDATHPLVIAAAQRLADRWPADAASRRMLQLQPVGRIPSIPRVLS